MFNCDKRFQSGCVYAAISAQPVVQPVFFETGNVELIFFDRGFQTAVFLAKERVMNFFNCFNPACDKGKQDF